MKVELKLLDPRLADKLPRYQSAGAAGVDLLAALAAPCELAPNQVQLIPSGIAIHLADPGYCALILPRSGLGHKGLVLGNLVGLIDSDYQGEITLSAWNRSESPITIEPLMRLAQLVVVPVAHASWSVVDHFEPSQRGDAGFGSTGL